MNFTNGNMTVRAMCMLRKAVCESNKNASGILQRNINFVILSRSKTTKNVFEPTNKMFKRKAEITPQLKMSDYLLLGIPLLTFGLGTWQIFRYSEKLKLIDKLSNRTARKPMELPENINELSSKEYYPVKVRGEFLHDLEFLVGPRAFVTNKPLGHLAFGKTDVGYLVITPFRVEGKNMTILINRGWVPKAQMHPSKRRDGQVEGTVELVGLVRFSEKRPPFAPKNKPEEDIWIIKDINLMAQMADTEPLCLEAVAESTVPGGPIGGQTKVAVTNNHVSYILTWYGLCAGTLYYWYKLRYLPRH